MNLQGSIIALIVLLILIAEMVSFKWVKKITNSYFFWLAISVIIIVYYLSVRYVNIWIQYGQKLSSGELAQLLSGDLMQRKTGSAIISEAFMLDICPFLALFMPIFLIIDPSRKIARAFAPVCFVGAVAVIFGQFPFMIKDAELTWKYIFMGKDHDCYCLIHSLNICLSFGVMLCTPKFDWNGRLWMFVFTMVYLIYAAIVSHATNCQYFASGTVLGDWEIDGGLFWNFTEAFHTPARYTHLIFFPLFTIGCFALTFIFDDLIKHFRIYQYGNARQSKWYKGYSLNYFLPQNIW